MISHACLVSIFYGQAIIFTIALCLLSLYLKRRSFEDDKSFKVLTAIAKSAVAIQFFNLVIAGAQLL